MNSSGDAAESIIRMSLQGLEVATRISGSGAKNISVLLYTILKDNKKLSKGKTNLTNMLKSGKELKVFALKQSDLKKFTEEAKRYGVLFSALIDKKQKQSPDGLIDVMVKAEDAAKINRIVERFKLVATVDSASIKSEIEKEKVEQAVKEALEKGIEVKTIEDKIVDDILSKPKQKEENELSNPKLAKTEKNPLSEPSSKSKSEEGTKPKEKLSVREELKQIKQDEKKEQGLEKPLEKNKDVKVQETKHKQPNRSKKKKAKERG